MFGQLQVYSNYSFQNSTILIDDLCRLAKEKNIEALALTDKNNMYGAVEFYNACLQYGIKPILGMETSVMLEGEVYPFILLAKNDQGYLDLVKICSHIGVSETQSIDLELLKPFVTNLFIIDCHSDGVVRSLVEKELYDLANDYLTLFVSIFGNHYYLGIQSHAIEYQKITNDKLLKLSNEKNINVCCSNEVRYLFQEEAVTLDILHATTTGQILDMFYQPVTDQKYLKSYDEMKSLFDEDLLNHTKEIVGQCNAKIVFGQMHLPVYDKTGEINTTTYLKELCTKGLYKRLNNKVDSIYMERLTTELETIEKMGFCDYFLIVFDYVRYAKRKGIVVGPGRGSAAGSLVAYVLGITNVDPIQYNLFFERFLNIERISMPDIDIDFQDDRRDEVVQYVTNKYGQEHVAQIITFSSYGPKVAIKDLGKVFGISLVKLDMLCNAIGKNNKVMMSVLESYNSSYAFQSIIHGDALLKHLLPSFILVEKLYKNTSTHAAGVVLSGDPLDSILPIIKGNTGVITQYGQSYIEKIGLLKMDFLGITNLTILHQVCNEITKESGYPFDINQIPLHDVKAFELLARGDTLGVFQLESAGMTSLIQKMKCDRLDHIIATIALHRPGPMKNIDSYLDRKNGIEKITYPIDAMEPILKDTNGIMIYQEQIMQVAQLVANFSLAKADVLRAAISKKNESMMKSLKEEFIAGGIKNGYPQQKVEEVYALIERFADYGFNKAHSVAYGLIAYQLAYLKANYPLAFYSALLTRVQNSDIGKERCVQECQKYGITILPPSINYSTNEFQVEKEGIRFSLISVKQFGLGAYQVIQEERNKALFKDVFDFVSRIDASKVNKATLESLIDAGAFDEFGYGRATLKLNYSLIENHRELAMLGIDEPPILVDKKEQEVVRLELEKNALGVYLSKHPIHLFIEQYPGDYVGSNQFVQFINKQISSIAIVLYSKQIVDKKGSDMCFLTLYDEFGQFDGVVFSTEYAKIKNKIKQGGTYIIQGRIQSSNKLSCIITNIEEINLRA